MKSNLKPWQLAYVSDEKGTVIYIGELVSMPTNDGTVMVRLIPGHPGMLNEEPVDRCELVEAGYWYVHYASIDGNRNYFPVDMLRSDRCLPVSFKLEMDPDRQTLRPVIEDESQMLIVAQVTRRRWPNWTAGRWQSFNWGLSEMDTETFVQHPQTETQGEAK